MSFRRWLPAVGLVAVLAGCGGSGGDGSSDAAPEPAPAESSPATTEPAPDASTDEPAPASTAPAANAAPGTFNWTLVDEAPLYADDSHALGAASNGEEVVGVGYRSTDGAEEIAVAWRTRDGRTWERSELPQPAGAGLGGSNAFAAAAWSGGWVVAGVLKGDDTALAVWTSSDGETWAAVESPAFADDEERIGGVSPSAVAASETAIVVGGAAETIDQGAAVWRSTDGLRVAAGAGRRAARVLDARRRIGRDGVRRHRHRHPLRPAQRGRGLALGGRRGVAPREIAVARRGRRGRRAGGRRVRRPGAGGSPGTS